MPKMGAHFVPSSFPWQNKIRCRVNHGLVGPSGNQSPATKPSIAWTLLVGLRRLYLNLSYTHTHTHTNRLVIRR